MKNKILAVILVMVVLLTSGCGANNYIKDKDNKMVSLAEKMAANVDMSAFSKAEELKKRL